MFLYALRSLDGCMRLSELCFVFIVLAVVVTGRCGPRDDAPA